MARSTLQKKMIFFLIFTRFFADATTNVEDKNKTVTTYSIRVDFKGDFSLCLI